MKIEELLGVKVIDVINALGDKKKKKLEMDSEKLD
jgi:hypothetical protein